MPIRVAGARLRALSAAALTAAVRPRSPPAPRRSPAAGRRARKRSAAGRNQPAVRIVPAHQCLDADDAMPGPLDLGLVVPFRRFGSQGMPERFLGCR